MKHATGRKFIEEEYRKRNTATGWRTGRGQAEEENIITLNKAKGWRTGGVGEYTVQEAGHRMEDRQRRRIPSRKQVTGWKAGRGRGNHTGS
jgi:hypothetical protein